MLFRTLFIILVLNIYFSVCLQNYKNTRSLTPIEKMDSVLAFLFNYGDPAHEYPSLTKILKACNMKWRNGLKEMMGDLIGLIQAIYPNNEYVHKVAELMFSTPLIPNDECAQVKGPMSRTAKAQTLEINKRRFDAKHYRILINIVMSDAIKPSKGRIDNKQRLSKLICYFKLWIENTISVYPEKNGVRKRVKEHIERVLDEVLEYLQTLTERTDYCDFEDYEPLGVYKPHYKSLQLNLIDAINNLTTE